MRKVTFSMRRAAAAGVAVATLAGCSMDVKNPTVVDASTIDPLADARVFSLSAQQNFYQAFGGFINSTAYYATETWSGAVRNETNDIGRRLIVDRPLRVTVGRHDVLRWTRRVRGIVSVFV